MAWKMSTTPSVFTRSNWEWIHRNVPVRPTPSLHVMVSLQPEHMCTHNACTLLPHLHMTTVGFLGELLWAFVKWSMRKRTAEEWGSPCTGQLVSCIWVTIRDWEAILGLGLSSTTSIFLSTRSPWLVTFCRVTFSPP